MVPKNIAHKPHPARYRNMTSGASRFIHLLNVGIAKSGISGVREGGEFELRGRRGRIPGCIRADSDAVEGLLEGRVVHDKQVRQTVLFSMRGEHPGDIGFLLLVPKNTAHKPHPARHRNMTSGASGFIHLLNVGIAKSGISGVREGGEFELRGRRGGSQGASGPTATQ